MKIATTLKLRMIVDIAFILAALLTAPAVALSHLKSVVRGWGLWAPLAVNIGGFLIAGWFWFDFLRTWQALRNLPVDKSTAE